MTEGELLWTPSPEFVENSNLHRFTSFLERERGLHFKTFTDLHHWSISDLNGFWQAVWTYFDIQTDEPYKRVIDEIRMPGAKWFEGSRINYAEHILRGARFGDSARPAILSFSEARLNGSLSWDDLGTQVRQLATSLRGLGITRGDTVVCYMPNIPETVVAMLATVSIGAIWASAAPEFGTSAVVDRFHQIKPKLLFAIDGYKFNGKDHDRTSHVGDLIAALPTLEQVVWLPYLNPEAAAPSASAVLYADLLSAPPVAADDFKFEKVGFDEALWVLFSSGTTGLPKAIVHSHVGMLLTHLVSSFHNNFREHSRVLFYTTTGWMVFNALVGTMLTGAALVTYDGSPSYPRPDVLFKLAAEAKATGFAASPTYVQGMRKLDQRPGANHDLSSLEYMMVTGSPAQPEVFEWVYNSVKSDLWMCAPCGGTELCSTMVGGVPSLPVRAGEIQAATLGIDVRAFDAAGNTVVNEVGELVIATPAPCMPLHFWNDPDGKRYFESYFNKYPGIWRHGDFIKFNDNGSSVIYGRSDATLNRHGVRIGTSEIYRCVEGLPEIADSIVVCIQHAQGSYHMPLFIRLKPGAILDGDLRSKIATSLRNDCSPRHVPDSVHAVESIPYTLTGKKMEIPVRKILEGLSAELAASRDAMKDPSALDVFAEIARRGDLLDQNQPSTQNGL